MPAARCAEPTITLPLEVIGGGDEPWLAHLAETSLLQVCESTIRPSTG
jgi:hypothetical protein